MSRPHEPLSVIGLRRATGCHVNTIKKWLNGESMKPECAEKIEAAIQRLGGTVISDKSPKESRSMQGEPR